MNRTDVIGVSLVGAAVAGAVAIGIALRPGPTAGADGGAPPPVVLYALPDGGGWPIPPDAGVFMLGVPPNVVGQVDVVTPTGYERVTYALLGDGGYLLGTTPLPFACACAADATCVWVTDGGPVPSTGSYPTSAVTGNCPGRPCTELAGWTGAPAGCQP